jgi:hypothetical protein
MWKLFRIFKGWEGGVEGRKGEKSMYSATKLRKKIQIHKSFYVFLCDIHLISHSWWESRLGDRFIFVHV